MMAPAMSLLARMDRLPFSRPHYALLVIGGLGYAFDGADNALVAFLLPSMAREWDLDNGALGLLAAAGPVGYLVGALVAGTLGDRIGRRPIMMWALAIYTVCTMVAALAPTYEVFAAARILAGVGIGAESVIVAPYLSEFVPPARRGWFVGCLAGFFSFGYVAAALLGRFVVPATDAGWRWAQVVTAVPIVLLLWWRRSLLESPRFLLAHGRRAEAERVVTAFEDKVRRATGAELPPLTGSASDADVVVTKVGLTASLRFLWGPSMRRRTAVVWLVWFVNVFAFYGFFTWIPTPAHPAGDHGDTELRLLPGHLPRPDPRLLRRGLAQRPARPQSHHRGLPPRRRGGGVLPEPEHDAADDHGVRRPAVLLPQRQHRRDLRVHP